MHERLRLLRTAKQMTQAEVAERLYVTRQAISSYESGRTEPDMETLKCLAGIYGVSVQDFFDSEEPDGSRAEQRMLRLLRGTEGVLFVCTLVRAILLWLANRFYAVPEGQVSQEMMTVLETRWSIMEAAKGLESVLLAGSWWLGTLLLVQSVQLSVPVKRQWTDLGILAGGMLLATTPWALADPTFGFWDSFDAIMIGFCRVLVLLLVGVLGRGLSRKKT